MVTQGNAAKKSRTKMCRVASVRLHNNDDGEPYDLFIKGHARFQLLPHQKLNRHQRRGLVARPSFSILNASQTSGSYKSFDQEALQTIMSVTNLFIVWGSRIDDKSADIVQKHIYASRHVVLILTNSDEENSWIGFAKRNTKDAHILAFVSRDQH